jgi:hypothetical protein
METKLVAEDYFNFMIRARGYEKSRNRANVAQALKLTDLYSGGIRFKYRLGHHYID